MIRRDLPLGSKPREWVLISQVEHARISAELAAHWGNNDIKPVVCQPDDADPKTEAVRREVLAAITHHDGGWAAWEAAPALDAAEGRPLDFLEIPLADSLVIWQESIRAARSEGPLAGSMVAGHFLALLDGSQHSHEPLAIAWRKTVETQRADWLREWSELNPQLHTPELAERALRWLQCFDWLSLWLCCKCPALPADLQASIQPLQLEIPGANGQRIIFRAAVTTTDLQVVATPWPFDVPKLSLTAECPSVSVGRFRTTRELLAAQRPARLHWPWLAVPS